MFNLIIKNNKNIDEWIEDLGVCVLKMHSFNILDIFDLKELQSSEELKHLIQSRQIIINDGNQNLNSSQAIHYINYGFYFDVYKISNKINTIGAYIK